MAGSWSAVNFESVNVVSTPRTTWPASNPDGSLDSGFWLAGVDGWVMAAAVDGWGKTCLGGWFNNYRYPPILFPPQLTPRNSVLRLIRQRVSGSDLRPGSLGRTTGSTPWFLGPDRSLYLGGYFTLFHITARGGIAKLNPDGSVNTTFNPLGVNTGPGGGSVSALALQPDQHLLLGGFFNNVNGIQSNTTWPV